MELLKLSKFKLQLQCLVTEVRHLREKEGSAANEYRTLLQKLKQSEDEYGRRVQQLEAELAASNDLRQKLERKVNYLQNDNILLENKHKELKATLQSVLQSRDSFVNAYQESTCEMKRLIEARDRKLDVMMETIKSHLMLFDSIEKEACSIKRVVDNVQQIVSEKEDVVAGLRSKMDKVSSFEKTFVEKICYLEEKLKKDEDELQRKNRIISDLESQVEAAKITNNCQSQIEELQRTLSSKDAQLQTLISDKETLHLQVTSLTAILHKIQETLADMNDEDKRAFFSMLRSQEDHDLMDIPKEDDRTEDVIQNDGGALPTNYSAKCASQNQASPACQEQKPFSNPLPDNNHLDSCVSEFACSTPQSACFEPQSAHNAQFFSENYQKVTGDTTLQHLDSECSTTQAETAENPG